MCAASACTYLPAYLPAYLPTYLPMYVCMCFALQQLHADGGRVLPACDGRCSTWLALLMLRARGGSCAAVQLAGWLAGWLAGRADAQGFSAATWHNAGHC